jgi:hypothetical protein
MGRDPGLLRLAGSRRAMRAWSVGGGRFGAMDRSPVDSASGISIRTCARTRSRRKESFHHGSKLVQRVPVCAMLIL